MSVTCARCQRVRNFISTLYIIQEHPNICLDLYLRVKFEHCWSVYVCFFLFPFFQWGFLSCSVSFQTPRLIKMKVGTTYGTRPPNTVLGGRRTRWQVCSYLLLSIQLTRLWHCVLLTFRVWPSFMVTNSLSSPNPSRGAFHRFHCDSQSPVHFPGVSRSPLMWGRVLPVS